MNFILYIFCFSCRYFINLEMFSDKFVIRNWSIVENFKVEVEI